MTAEPQRKYQLAIEVAVAAVAGAVGLASAEAGAVATGLSPVAIAGLDRIAGTVRSRRLKNAAETVMDGAEAFGATTEVQFIQFVEAAVSDAEHQELLARTLTIAQDAAMRDKRRALGRSLASAASDTGTRVDEELLFVRVLADLDEPHIRMLRLLSTTPEHLIAMGMPKVRQWFPWSIAEADPGIANATYALLMVLERHGLAWGTREEYHVPGGGMESQYDISPYGEWFLTRLAEPEDLAADPLGLDVS